MLTARSVIITVLVIAVLSIVLSIVSLMQEPDSGGRGRDTYGTRAQGQRGLFETLSELGVAVDRSLVPPSGVLHRQVTLVFFEPDATLVNVEPSYLLDVAKWVRRGGRVVVAPPLAEDAQRQLFSGAMFNEDAKVTTVLGALGLANVKLVSADLTPPKSADADEPARSQRLRRYLPDYEQLLPARPRAWESTSRPIRADGELAALADVVATLDVPASGLQVISPDSAPPPDGRVTVTADDGGQHVVAALYTIDQGKVAIVSDPRLLVNRELARSDNPVLAAHLVADWGRPIVFDEFYHGLTVRGNPLWLLTRHPYGLLAAMLLLSAGLWAWRQAVHLGPPLAARDPSRRTVGEYVEAMARMFLRGRQSRPFITEQVRDGVLWSLRKRLGLGPGQENVQTIATVLAKRDAAAAQRLKEAAAAVDVALDDPTRLNERRAVNALQRITQCL